MEKIITRNNGTKEWYVNGQLHRVDGPAIEWRNDTKEWWINGVRHRTDNAAVEYPNGDKAWWVNGVEITPEEIMERTGIINFENMSDVDKVVYALTY